MTTETQEETMTDTKGAQPEQLVENLRKRNVKLRRERNQARSLVAEYESWLDEALKALGIENVFQIDAVATALSECRERLALASREAHTALHHPGRWEQCDSLECRLDRAALAAQPPSEALSEGGTLSASAGDEAGTSPPSESVAQPPSEASERIEGDSNDANL